MADVMLTKLISSCKNLNYASNVPNGLINNGTTLIYVMAWNRTGDEPLSELMMVLFTDISYHSVSMS